MIRDLKHVWWKCCHLPLLYRSMHRINKTAKAPAKKPQIAGSYNLLFYIHIFLYICIFIHEKPKHIDETTATNLFFFLFTFLFILLCLVLSFFMILFLSTTLSLPFLFIYQFLIYSIVVILFFWCIMFFHSL